MDPIQALDMLSQVVKGARMPYNEHVLLERSIDVLRQAITGKSGNEPAELLEEDEGVVLEDAPKKKTKPAAKRGGRRAK
jgi:hypothetical protein